MDPQKLIDSHPDIPKMTGGGAARKKTAADNVPILTEADTIDPAATVDELAGGVWDIYQVPSLRVWRRAHQLTTALDATRLAEAAKQMLLATPPDDLDEDAAKRWAKKHAETIDRYQEAAAAMIRAAGLSWTPDTSVDVMFALALVLIYPRDRARADRAIQAPPSDDDIDLLDDYAARREITGIEVVDEIVTRLIPALNRLAAVKKNGVSGGASPSAK